MNPDLSGEIGATGRALVRDGWDRLRRRRQKNHAAAGITAAARTIPFIPFIPFIRVPPLSRCRDHGGSPHRSRDP